MIANTDNIVTMDGNAYFPPEALDPACFQPSEHRSVCGWKGEVHYYNVVVQSAVNANAAWYHPDPKQTAEQLKYLMVAD